MARELELTTLAGCSLELIEADLQRLRDLGKQHGAIVEHWRVCAPSTATARPAGGWSEMVASITSDPKYNGLFRAGGDLSPEEAAELQRLIDRSDPIVDSFLTDCGL